MLSLQLPPTIRLARADELPDTAANTERIELGQQANIVPGYTLRPNANGDLPFRFYAEINVNNGSLWNVFNALADHLPSPVCLIYHHTSETETYSPYTERDEVLGVLKDYQTELTQDAFLCAGVLHYAEEHLEEVYLDNTKYLKYWGMDEIFFRRTMERFSLSDTPHLSFIDQYPRATEPLSLHVSGCLATWEVLGQLLRRFGQEKK
jgi:hypothetical protein